jgi:cell division septum initiation protein DivIVA
MESDYVKELEAQNEELKEKLAEAQMSFRSYKAIASLVSENCTVEWQGERVNRTMCVKAVFRVTPKDVLAAKDYPEAKELFEKFKTKADEAANPNF